MSLNRITTVTRTIALLAALFTEHATASSTRAEKQSLQTSARATLDAMIAQEPRIRTVIQNAPGYAVFPSIAQGGALIGGAYGRGILYEHGQPTGFVSLEQVSIGAQLGGQSFAELLVLHTPQDVAAVKSGDFTAGAQLGIVVLSASANARASFDPNASIFVMGHGGLMVDVSISGQKISYQPMNNQS